MTTIAYHHESKTIAVDSRRTCGSVITSDKTNKIQKVCGLVFVLCGTVSDKGLFIDMYVNGSESNVIPDITGYVIDNGTAYLCHVNENGVMQKYELEHNDAIGSGEQFALSAMDFGKNAKEAVKYAMTRDTITGGKIREVKI